MDLFFPSIIFTRREAKCVKIFSGRNKKSKANERERDLRELKTAFCESHWSEFIYLEFYFYLFIFF